jgi:pimeloyl-ACP methyl ester carboxylesterase
MKDRHVTVVRDGCSLHVTCSGSGTPLLFLHGLGSDSTDSRRGLGEMPGFEIALVDQRGHGKSSPVTNVDGFSLGAMVADVAAVIAALGWSRPVVGGGSMGAAVALSYALAHPDACAALVLVAPALSNHRHPAAASFQAIADRIDAVGLELAAAEVAQQLIVDGAAPAAAEAAVAPWLKQDPASLAAGMRAVFGWRPFNSFDELAVVKVPVAIIAVPGDEWHPLALAEQLHRRLSLSDLEVLPSLQVAWEPGSTGAAIRRSLSRLTEEVATS